MSVRRFYIAVSAASAACWSWLVWNLGHISSGVTVCLFKSVTHLPCPSCGTTRALIELASGHVRESLLLNPLGALAALVLVAVPFWLLFDLTARKNTLHGIYIRAEQLLNTRLALSLPLIALVAMNWLWNISKGL